MSKLTSKRSVTAPVLNDSDVQKRTKREARAKALTKEVERFIYQVDVVMHEMRDDAGIPNYVDTAWSELRAGATMLVGYAVRIAVTKKS
jgi:hypothetical protein